MSIDCPLKSNLEPCKTIEPFHDVLIEHGHLWVPQKFQEG
jgi:hypothetical protein